MNNKKIKALTILSLILSAFCNAQVRFTFYDEFKKYSVCIGATDTNGKFFEIGSGFVTYIISDTTIVPCIITAKHVVSFFEKNNIPAFYIRFSWADSIQTSKYAGLRVPLHYNTKINNYFKPKDTLIDLACIILNNDSDSVSGIYYKKNHPLILPMNSIVDADLGENVLIYGYPGHVENVFNKFNYSVCTIKTGFVSWVSHDKINPEIDNYILVESNSTFGNSGGAVFSLNTGISANTIVPKLIGIVIGGFEDEPSYLQLDGKQLIDSAKRPYYVVPKSGVTTVLKADIIRKFLLDVTSEVVVIMRKPSK